MASWAASALRDDLIRVSGHSAATGWKTAAALHGELGEVVRAVYPYYGDELDSGAISSTRLLRALLHRPKDGRESSQFSLYR